MAKKLNRMRRLGLMCRLAKRSPPGDIVEVGVYRGRSARLLYQVSQRRKAKLWLYDTFTGHPHHVPGLDHPSEVVGHRSVEVEYLDAIKKECPDAIITEGIFPHSVHARMKSIAFAHVDVDSYQSTYETIECLKPRMQSGGVMLFDDYGKIRGARAAVQKHFKMKEIWVAPIIRRAAVMLDGDIHEFMRTV